MGKGKDSKKATKKAPAKTAKEKRAEKKHYAYKFNFLHFISLIRYVNLIWFAEISVNHLSNNIISLRIIGG